MNFLDKIGTTKVYIFVYPWMGVLPGVLVQVLGLGY